MASCWAGWICDAKISVSVPLNLLDQRKFGHVTDYQKEFVKLEALTGKKTWNGDGNSWRVQFGKWQT